VADNLAVLLPAAAIEALDLGGCGHIEASVVVHELQVSGLCRELLNSLPHSEES
jgi:hypothetical protein